MVLMRRFTVRAHLVRAHLVRALVGVGVLLVLGAPAWALEGQRTGLSPRPLPAPAPGHQVHMVPMALSSVATGWLGFRVRYEVTGTAAHIPAGGRVAGRGLDDWEQSHRVRVAEVVPNGPAQAAGMAAGDRILEIDGVDASQAIEQGTLAGVQPGQVVRFGIERDGRALELRVVAAPRPEPAAPASTVALARIRTDSIVSLMQIRMDSARSSVAREAVRLRVARPEPPPEPRAWVANRAGFPVDTVAFSGNRVLGTGTGAQTLGALVSGGGDMVAVRGLTAARAPILVLATGHRAVMGAEVTPLNPGLASYFGVDAGLLVTQVVEGAPGDRGGLSPGDVIVRVGSRPVATVEELRAAAEAGFRSPPLVLGVIREGRRLELRVPR